MRLSNKKLSELTTQLRSAEKELEELKVTVSVMTAAVETAEAAKAAADAAKAAAETSLEKALKQAPPVVDQKTPAASASLEICRYFVQGTCRNGAQCKFRHEMPSATIAPASIDTAREPDTPFAVTVTQDVEQTRTEADSTAVLEAVTDHKRKASELEEPISLPSTEEHKTEQSTEETRLAEMRTKLLESKRLKVPPRVVEEEEGPSEEFAHNAEAAPPHEPSAPAAEELHSELAEAAEGTSADQTQTIALSDLPTFGSGSGKLSTPSVAGVNSGFFAPPPPGLSLFKSGRPEAAEAAASPLDKSTEDASEDSKALAHQTPTLNATLSAVSLRCFPIFELRYLPIGATETFRGAPSQV